MFTWRRTIAPVSRNDPRQNPRKRLSDQDLECAHVCWTKRSRKRARHQWHLLLPQFPNKWWYPNSSCLFDHEAHHRIEAHGESFPSHYCILYWFLLRVPPPGRSTKGQKVSWQVCLLSSLMSFSRTSSNRCRARDHDWRSLLWLKCSSIMKPLLALIAINTVLVITRLATVIRPVNMTTSWKIFKRMRDEFKDWSMGLECSKNE